MRPQWKNSRKLKERIIIRGKLVLETPTHVGNGDTDGPLDMPLLVDALEGHAMLPGSSLAGALREVLDEFEARMLFGHVTDKASQESFLMIDDALAQDTRRELRDGVAIDPTTRTAEEKKKFDIELLAVGTEFPTSLELLVPQSDDGSYVRALAKALTLLQQGHIRLGKRKRRGFGKCTVTSWQVCRYDLTTVDGLRNWLLERFEENCQQGTDIRLLLGLDDLAIPARRGFLIKATFILNGSMLIRSGFGEPGAPDVVHLHSLRNGKYQPVLSGTSLAGALRARALKIANTIYGKDSNQGARWVDRIFGNRDLGNLPKSQRKALTASRLWVEETVIENALELVQTRVKIDRFTGGTFPAALFNEQPVWGKLREETQVTIELFLEPSPRPDQPIEPEIGLLLLLLKDLWTGDLPLGGESGVGRGRLRGSEARLAFNDETWVITENTDGSLAIQGNAERLDEFVNAFVNGGA